MKPKIPKAISHGHSHLCCLLKTLLKNYEENSELKLLNDVMTAHFHKEEKYALPPLGLLLNLSEGDWQLDEDTAIDMAEAVNSKLAELQKDHENIEKLIQSLKSYAENGNYYDLERFINDLEIHMELEDQVLYPAAVLIGNYFKKLTNTN